MSSISADAFIFADLEERLSLPDIDGALLMELLDDPGFEDDHAEADRLGCVMRSLEAELDGVETVDESEVVEYCKLEDVVLSDIGSHASSMAPYIAEDQLFDQWVDVDMEVVSEGMGGWYEEGVDQFMMGDVGEYAAAAAAAAFYNDHQGDYSSSMEHAYMPLWQ